MDEHTQSYNEFIRLGDASPTVSASQPRLSTTSVSTASTAGTPASGPASGPAPTTNNRNRNSMSNSNSPPAQQSSSDSRDGGGGFLSSFFRKATNTIESSLQAAQQNGSEALRTAEQHMSAASSSALSTVTGLVLDLGTSFNSNSSSDRNNPNNDPNHLDANTRPETTSPIKSLRVPSPAIPLLLFDAPVTTVVSQSALHIFTQGASSRPTPVPLNIVQTRISATTSPAPPHAAVTATHAAIMPGPRLAVAHDDGSVVVFSMSASRVAAFEAATPPHPSPTTALVALNPAGLAVARRDGSIHLLNAALQPVHNLPAPDLCAAPLTPSLTTAAAIALAPVKQGVTQPRYSGSTPTNPPSALAVAYDDGSVCTFSNSGQPTGPAFVAHAGPPAGITTVFGDDVIVTAGNSSDKCIAVFDRYSGRCLARRSIPFTPTCLQPINPTVPPESCADSSVCPSATAVLVGGDESQVEAFRIVAVSARKVDIKLVLRIGEGQRGKKRGVRQISYRHEGRGTLSAVCENGEVRRWEIGRADAAQLCLLEEDRWTGATFNEGNIAAKIQEENDRIQGVSTGNGGSANRPVAPPEAQLHVANGVVRAQSILAAILDDRQVPEDRKDELVTSFQRMQTEMRSALADAEKDVRRARRRIFGQFALGVKDDFSDKEQRSRLENRLAKETKRAAAFEAEYVTRRYVEYIQGLERSTVEKMKKLLTDFLKSLSSTDSLILRQARGDVEMLGTEDAEVEVD